MGDSPFLPLSESSDESSSMSSDTDFEPEPVGYVPEISTPQTGRKRKRKHKPGQSSVKVRKKCRPRRGSMLNLGTTKLKVRTGNWEYQESQPEIDISIDPDEFEEEICELELLVESYKQQLGSTGLKVSEPVDHILLWLKRTELLEVLVEFRRTGGSQEEDDKLKSELIDFIFYSIQIGASRTSPQVYDKWKNLNKSCPMTSKLFYNICSEIEGPKERRNKRAGPKELEVITNSSALEGSEEEFPDLYTSSDQLRILQRAIHKFNLFASSCCFNRYTRLSLDDDQIQNKSSSLSQNHGVQSAPSSKRFGACFTSIGNTLVSALV